MSDWIPPIFLDMLTLADASWHSALATGLERVARANPAYLPELANDAYLPTKGRLFAAFAQPLSAVRYVLVGEGPYPREVSATGVCFMDGAVGALWSEKGLSKAVNRATSLRNFMKMLLLASGQLRPNEEEKSAAIARTAQQALQSGSAFIQTLAELQANLIKHGFLLLNAALVYRPHIPPVKEAKAWRPFLETVLTTLADFADAQRGTPATLVLWGKIAEQLHALPIAERFPKAIAEHPYNLSFIDNAAMHALFGPMRLLSK